jgi:pilus assembly protein CpaD
MGEIGEFAMKNAAMTLAPGAPADLRRNRNGFVKIAFAATLVSLVGLTAGCAQLEADLVTVNAVPDDYRTRHPIVVSQSEAVEDIVVSSNARRLSLRDRSVVEDFGRRFKRSGNENMAILVPRGSPNEVAARAVASDAVKFLQQEGISAGQIHVRHYSAAKHGDAATVRLVYSDIAASVPSQCGLWPTDVMWDSQNRNYENFGCATQHNLAAIVANPADLLGPRGETGIDAVRRTNVINEWREVGTFAQPVLLGQ